MSVVLPEAGPDRGEHRRESRSLAVAELAAVVALTAGHRYVPLSATPFLFALGWASLRLRGLRWRDVGLVRPRRWLVTLGLGALACFAMEASSMFVSEPLLARLVGEPADLSDFRPLVGSPKLLVPVSDTLAFVMIYVGRYPGL
jgi:hypothetical protein